MVSEMTDKLKGTTFFNVALATLIALSILSSRFQSASTWLLLAAVSISIVTPLIARRLDTRSSRKEDMPSSELKGIEDTIDARTSTEHTNLIVSRDILTIAGGALQQQSHSDAYTRILNEIGEHVTRHEKTPSKPENGSFQLTLNIISLYIGADSHSRSSDVKSKQDYILAPDLAPELYVGHDSMC